jgi:hypothetical protein
VVMCRRRARCSRATWSRRAGLPAPSAPGSSAQTGSASVSTRSRTARRLPAIRAKCRCDGAASSRMLLSSERATARRARDPPMEVRPSPRRGLCGERLDRRAACVADAQREMVGEIVRGRSAAADVEHGIEREARQLEQRDAHLHRRAGRVELPARVRHAARVRGGGKRRSSGQRDREAQRRALHGCSRTRTSACARRSSR